MSTPSTESISQRSSLLQCQCPSRHQHIIQRTSNISNSSGRSNNPELPDKSLNLHCPPPQITPLPSDPRLKGSRPPYALSKQRTLLVHQSVQNSKRSPPSFQSRCSSTNSLPLSSKAPFRPSSWVSSKGTLSDLANNPIFHISFIHTPSPRPSKARKQANRRPLPKTQHQTKSGFSAR